MKCGGTFSPRRLCFGLQVSAAQSRGEKPGSRTALLDEEVVEGECLGGFRDGCAGGARLLPDERRCGPRCDAAAEGGGALLPLPSRGGYRPGLGLRNWDWSCWACCPVARDRGRGGGGIKEEESACEGAGCGGDIVDDDDGVAGSGRGGIVAVSLATVVAVEL